MINSIVFNRTPDVFLNSGIVALYHYLSECKENQKLGYSDYDFLLEANKLTIECESQDKLFKLLEDVYYYMGKEVYDHSLDDGNVKYYFKEKPFQAIEFVKMMTYGVGGLITKPPFGPQPVPRNEEDAVYFKDIIEGNRKEFALEIAKFYTEKKIKIKSYEYIDGKIQKNESVKTGDSRIFLNQPYTKTPKLLIIKPQFFMEGNCICTLTGERYKELVDIQNTSVFISGESGNTKFFESFSNITKSKRISWKAMYISRFSPKLSFYKYNFNKSTICCYYFNSNDLLNINKIYRQNCTLYKDEVLLKQIDYESNINFGNDLIGDRSSQTYEIAFGLIYSFYLSFLKSSFIENADEYDPFADYNQFPISLVAFKAEKFGKDSMRPSQFDYINNFRFLLRLINYVEKKGISIKDVFYSLAFENKDKKNETFRNKILDKILNLKTIIEDIEYLFYYCFLYRLSNKDVRYKDYKQLFKFFELYEAILKFGGNKFMEEELQQKAISLGKSIGQGILHLDSTKDNITNAKNGRGYIISLKKARTEQQFLDGVIRIQTKFGIRVNDDILEKINPQNFNYIKQFAIISALNQINSLLFTSKK